jgi:hypothetical protein
LEIEALSNQFQLFLANQMAKKELGANSRGILITSIMGNQERELQGVRNHIRGDPTSNQKHYRVGV